VRTLFRRRTDFGGLSDRDRRNFLPFLAFGADQAGFQTGPAPVIG